MPQLDQLYGTSSLAVGTERAARRGNVQVLGGGSLWDTKYTASLLLSCDTFASSDLVPQTAATQIDECKHNRPNDSREELPVESPTYPLSPNGLRRAQSSACQSYQPPKCWVVKFSKNLSRKVLENRSKTPRRSLIFPYVIRTYLILRYIYIYIAESEQK